MSQELVQGAWDLHVHAAPGLFPRWGDARDLADACHAAGMRGVLLKAHHGSTVEVAAMPDVSRSCRRATWSRISESCCW